MNRKIQPMPVRFRFVQICQAQEASQAKQWTEAASLWEDVTRENPVTGDFWMQLAKARHNKQDYAGAITAYEKAMSLGVNGLRPTSPMKLPAAMRVWASVT